jgi:hypothetical protein
MNEFFPFVVESFGGFGVKAAEFVDAFVAASKSSHSVWCPREIVYSKVSARRIHGI